MTTMSAADPNRFAGPAEAALLHNEIAADTAVLAIVAERVAASESTLHAEKRAFQEAKERLDSAQQAYDAQRSDYASRAQRLLIMRGRFHPIRRLPAEILAEIFEAYLSAGAAAHPDGSDEQWHWCSLAPNTVAQVCRRWCRVAYDTPRLWRYISVVFRDRVDRTDDSETEDAGWIMALEDRIALAENAPVRLLVRGSFPKYGEEDDDLRPGYVPPEWRNPRTFWEPIIPLVRRCQAIRLVMPIAQGSFNRAGPLLRQHAPALEELDIFLCHKKEPVRVSFWDAMDRPTPHLHLNLNAPKLRRVALQGVLPEIIGAPNAFLYPGVTHAHISADKYFQREHVAELMPRFPSLSHLTLGPDDGSSLLLEWFAHPGVRHLSMGWGPPWLRGTTGAGPETFPALDSVDIRWSGPLASLAGAFGATGTLHAIRSLSLGVQMLDDELVRALDLLPRLESLALSGGTLARSFVQDTTWIRPPAGSRNWRCPALQDERLTGVKEIEPVGPETIVAWLNSRNSTSGAGLHCAIRAFEVKWENSTWSKGQVDGFEDTIRRLLAK